AGWVAGGQRHRARSGSAWTGPSMALGSHGRLPHATVTAMLSRDPYTALDAFLTEHRLCRPGLDDPDVSPILVALWCSCEARIAVRLPPGWRAAETALGG